MTYDVANSCLVRGNNSCLHGYIPILRECQGVTLVINGVYNLVLGGIAPYTNADLWRLGKYQLEYGIVNLVYSPITVTAAVVAIGCFGHKRTD